MVSLLLNIGGGCKCCIYRKLFQLEDSLKKKQDCIIWRVRLYKTALTGLSLLNTNFIIPSHPSIFKVIKARF